MIFNNFDELVSYIVKFFESRYNVKSESDLKDLAGNIATTLYILFDSSFVSSLDIPEHKLKLILALISVTYTTGKGAELNELTEKYSFTIRNKNV